MATIKHTIDEEEIDDEMFLRKIPQNHFWDRNLEEQRKKTAGIMKSMENSLSLLTNSEEIGMKTSQELLKQREKLQSTERHLDNVTSLNRKNNRYLETISGLFGSIKSFVHARGKWAASDKVLRKEDDYSVENLVFDRTDEQMARIRGNQSKSVEAGVQVNENLNKMITSLTTLKNMSLGMADEIDLHNTILNNIIYKAEITATSIEKQHKQIKKIIS